MARIDDYKEAFRLAAEELKKANLHRLAKLAGVDIELLKDGSVQLRVPLVGKPYLVRVGQTVDVVKEGDESEVPIQEKVLIGHYLLHASGDAPTDELITFRQVPDGHFYYDAFQRRARDPFLATFGKDCELFRTCAAILGGRPVDTGDVGMVFQALPRVPIRLVLWEGDDEFPPEASILFDSSVSGYLPAEDIAVLSGMVVYPLMGIARAQRSKAREVKV